MGKLEDNESELFGRHRIYTDEKMIDSSNVIRVLNDALITHNRNVGEIKFLIAYEKGFQPLQRKKKIRSDIDIKVCDNLASEIVDFKLGYNWGNPITYIQRGDNDLSKSDEKADDLGISMLNEMLDAEYSSTVDQTMLYYLETVGVGYQFVDVKRDYDGGAVFDFASLDPAYTFVIYDSTILRKPIMAVTYRVFDNGEAIYTCFTKERRYEVLNKITIINGKKNEEMVFGQRSGEMNPLGKIPIIEFNRSHDRTGIFERQISDMDALNILVSDFSNNVSQDVQALWWGSDFEFPEDSDGNTVTPESGQWLMTYSSENKKPGVQPLTIPTDYTGILSNIKYRREIIKQKCAVPQQTDGAGHSTGTAMSMSSGWQNAEVSACKETMFVTKGKMQIADLLLTAIQISPDIEPDSPLLDLHVSDIKPSIIRNKTYDLATKSNTFATWVSHGIHPRHALQQIEAFPDANLVYEDSKPYLEQYLNSVFKEDEKSLQGDVADQAVTSPILDGMTMTGGDSDDDNA